MKKKLIKRINCHSPTIFCLMNLYVIFLYLKNLDFHEHFIKMSNLIINSLAWILFNFPDAKTVLSSPN